ncbi:hypothetical protein BGW80DRAFT_1372276, partial [Lactifluus volemus]
MAVRMFHDRQAIPAFRCARAQAFFDCFLEGCAALDGIIFYTNYTFRHRPLVFVIVWIGWDICAYQDKVPILEVLEVVGAAEDATYTTMFHAIKYCRFAAGVVHAPPQPFLRLCNGEPNISTRNEIIRAERGERNVRVNMTLMKNEKLPNT